MRFRAAAISILLSALPAAAQTSVFLEDLTSPEVRNAITAAAVSFESGAAPPCQL